MRLMKTPRTASRKSVREHIRRYRASGGADGHQWKGAPTLLLTTAGARSGQPHTVPLIYGRSDDGAYLVVASYGGAARHPQWYRNLSVRPQAQIQVFAEIIDVEAHTAGPDEKPALWERMAALWPPYNLYQAHTARDIPVVALRARN